MVANSSDKIKIGLKIVIALLLAVGLFVFWPKTKSDKHEFYFHPDVVKEVEWEIAGKKWSATRPDRATPWTPATDGPAMQNRLIVLGTPDLEKMSAPSSGLRIKLTFGADNIGEGIYDDGQFVWTQGLKKGMGFKATERDQNILEEGQYAFTSHLWTWCASRPQRISGQLEDGRKFQLEIEKGQWYSVINSKKNKIDSTLIEQWLGRNCTLKIDFYKDRANFTGMLKRLTELSNAAEWTIDFVPSKTAKDQIEALKYVKKGKFWLVNDDMAIHSQQLDEALTRLYQTAQLNRQ